MANGKGYEFLRIDNFTGGLNLKNDDSVTAGGITPSQCIKAMNCDFRDHVSIQTRDSYKKKYLTEYFSRLIGIHSYYRNTEQHLMVKAWSNPQYRIYDGIKEIHSDISPLNIFFPAVYNNSVYLCDGINENKKYDGTDVTKMGIAAPDTAPTLAEGGAGNLDGTYYYYYSYYNSNTGHESALSPVGEITVASKSVTVTPPLSSDSQVTHIRIYRAGGNAGYTDSEGTYTKHRISSDANGEIDVNDASLGTDLIGNGTFDDSSWWDTISNVTISGGEAYVENLIYPELEGYLEEESLLSAGTGYQIRFQITECLARNSDGVKICTVGVAAEQEVTDWVRNAGYYVYNFTATYTGLKIKIKAGNGGTTGIDNVSVESTTLGYSDDTADTGLTTTVEDCDTNDVLAATRMLYVHHHQMYGAANDDYPGYLYVSRFFKPEAFPALYFTGIGHASNPIVAIMPYEIDMIIYTRYKIYRYRYIGSGETDVILEELSDVGCAAGKTLCEGTLENGMPFHIFLGQATRGRGIYMFDGQAAVCISTIIEPLFSGERSDVTSMNWNYVENCCGAIADNKYYLSYPEGATDWPDKVIIADFETSPPKFTRADFSASALHYDIFAGVLYMGNEDGYLYEFTGAHNLSERVELDFQTPYVGDRTRYFQLKSLIFFANTRDQDMTVKVWVDRCLKDTLTCSSTYMTRIDLDCSSECRGRLFSIEFICASYRRIKITPPLLLKGVYHENY